MLCAGLLKIDQMFSVCTKTVYRLVLCLLPANLDIILVNKQRDSQLVTYRFISILYMFRAGCAVKYWLKHYATNRQVAGSIPIVVTGILQ
jgi:hypothetical protein